MKEMKKYRMRICGRNTITLPTPAMAPSTMSERSEPSAMWLSTKLPSHATPVSIQSIGYCPSENVVWNITNSNRKKMGKPTYLFESMSSRRCVVRYVSAFVPWRNSASISAPCMKPYFESIMAVSESTFVSSITRAEALSRAASIARAFPAFVCLTMLAMCVSCSRSFRARKRVE